MTTTIESTHYIFFGIKLYPHLENQQREEIKIGPGLSETAAGNRVTLEIEESQVEHLANHPDQILIIVQAHNSRVTVKKFTKIEDVEGFEMETIATSPDGQEDIILIRAKDIKGVKSISIDDDIPEETK